MAIKHFITLIALLWSIPAYADVIPYWGDRSCNDEIEGCEGRFPLLFADFTNTDTGASTSTSILFLGNGVYSSHFLEADTEEYRANTGCITCDVYDGIAMLDNLDVIDDPWNHPASVFPPSGFAYDSDDGYAIMAFDGERMRVIHALWRGFTAGFGPDEAALWMREDGTWQFWTLHENRPATIILGTWDVPRPDAARLSVSEPPTAWLLMIGLGMLAFVHLARNSPADPPAG